MEPVHEMMDDVRRGTWMVHTSKHLASVRSDVAELFYFEATDQAGKAGNLLARMAADNAEIIPKAKVIEFARMSGIRRGEVDHSLKLLRSENKVDYTVDPSGEIDQVEVYSFSASDSLITTARLFDRLNPSPHEAGSISTLERTFYIPQTTEDMLETLSASGLRDREAETTVQVQESLGLVKAEGQGAAKLYYNEYAFNDDPQKALRAISGLQESEIRNIKDIQQILTECPGYPMDVLLQKFPDKTIRMMEGIGMIDAMPVRSPNGQAIYATIPQLRGVAIGQPILSADVFHKAKTLLNCLRYGQFHSRTWRGKIIDDSMLLNVIRKLNRGEELNPSTAAGEDYRILEREGVIATRDAGGGLYFMRLRQKEVGLIVLQMLEHHSAIAEGDIHLQARLGAIAVDRDIPEVRRAEILAQRTPAVAEAQNIVLQVIRTGARSV